MMISAANEKSMSGEMSPASSSLHDKDFATGTRVLVAEDDPITRMMLSATLSSWGVEAIQVGDGDEALKVMFSDDPPRLALLDWIMPGKDGPQVCKELRTASPEPYIYTILLTSMDRKEDIVAGLDSGADDYVIKPYDPNELRVRLKAGERIVSPPERVDRSPRSFEGSGDPRLSHRALEPTGYAQQV